MFEKHYRVLDMDKHILASGMTFEMAMVFIKGFKETFFNERLVLTIEEELDGPCAEGELI